MMASLLSSWKSQRHLDFKCCQCMFLILKPGPLPVSEWSHPSILFYKTGSLASFTAPPLYPGHYQVMSAVPSKYLWIISVPSYHDLQVQGAQISYLYYCKCKWLALSLLKPELTFCSAVLSRVENNKSDNVILHSREYFQDFPKSFLL